MRIICKNANFLAVKQIFHGEDNIPQEKNSRHQKKREREKKKKEELVLAPCQIEMHSHVAVAHVSGFNCEHGVWH